MLGKIDPINTMHGPPKQGHLQGKIAIIEPMFYMKNKNRNTENLTHVYYEDKDLAALKKSSQNGTLHEV